MSIQEYFDGLKLIGDDYSKSQIKIWADEEKEAYANLGAQNKSEYKYKYHALNRKIGFSDLNLQKCKKVLGIGSAWGDEFSPIAKYIEEIIVLEPSEAFAKNTSILGIPAQYIRPNDTNLLPFDNEMFDLIVCLGALHHIPNVSFVLKEFYRCIKFDGIVIIREPIVSMGDWRNKRVGLTKNERGIPLRLFKKMLDESGFVIDKQVLCMFQPLRFFSKYSNIDIYNNKFYIFFDLVFSKIFSWNIRYHKERIWQKFGPTSVYYVVRKV